LRETINGDEFRNMLLCAASALNANKREINELNVFPVPDGDTGTNMSLTMAAAATELRKIPGCTLTKAADTAASALLRGARGNSGVILSLLFRGLAKSLKGKDEANALEFAAALADGVDSAYKAVAKPAEGTILTVARVATVSAVEFAEAGSDLELMLVCALSTAKEALENTVNQNPVLKRAGVIDAGGMGYVTILSAMLAGLQGRAAADDADSAADDAREHQGADWGGFDSANIEFAYDTVFIVRKTAHTKSLDLLRAYLESIGDSLVIGEDDEQFKVHVHTNIPGAAVTEAQKYGTLETCAIENMRTQHDELAAGGGESEKTANPAEDAHPDGYIAPAEKKYGYVSVCAGAGMEALLKELGADEIITGGQTMNPATADILRAINKTPAEAVFVFPNNKNIIMAAQQCLPLTEKKVIIIPTKNVPQGVSALLGADPSLDEETLTAELNAAAERVHTILVTYAMRDSEFDGYDIKANEYLALLDGALIGSFSDRTALISAITKSAAAFSPEFLTLYYGADESGADARETSEQLKAAFPDAEVSVIDGGQPVYYYMLAIE